MGFLVGVFCLCLSVCLFVRLFFQNLFSLCASQHAGKYNSDYPMLSYGRMSYAVHNELRLQVMPCFSNYISFGALWRCSLLEEYTSLERMSASHLSGSDSSK